MGAIVFIGKFTLNFILFKYFQLLHFQGHENVDLLQVRNILPAQGVETPRIRLRQEHLNNVHCSLDIFRCTLTKIPETNSILQKSRLPLGVLIHPFKDLTVKNWELCSIRLLKV